MCFLFFNNHVEKTNVFLSFCFCCSWTHIVVSRPHRRSERWVSSLTCSPSSRSVSGSSDGRSSTWCRKKVWDCVVKSFLLVTFPCQISHWVVKWNWQPFKYWLVINVCDEFDCFCFVSGFIRHFLLLQLLTDLSSWSRGRPPPSCPQ